MFRCKREQHKDGKFDLEKMMEVVSFLKSTFWLTLRLS